MERDAVQLFCKQKRKFIRASSTTSRLSFGAFYRDVFAGEHRHPLNVALHILAWSRAQGSWSVPSGAGCIFWRCFIPWCMQLRV